MKAWIVFLTLPLAGAIHRDPAGFSIDVPPGWSVQSFDGGNASVTSADGAAFALVSPVIGQRGDCLTLLRGAFANGWRTFPQAAKLQVKATGKGAAVADFVFDQGRRRGAVMCAATGPRSAMFYGMASPADRFVRDRPVLVAMLRSFRYGGGETGRGEPARAALPTEPWREATESAFTAVKPVGWRAEGGVARLSNLDVRVGSRLVSPDGQAAFVLGDVRLNKCMVPGPQTMQAPIGGGVDWCPYRQGTEVAEMYVMRGLARDMGVDGVRVTGRRARPDLTSKADQQASIVGGLGIRNAYGEITFEGTRRGAPVSGKMLANTQFMPSVDPNLLAGSYTQYVTGFVAPKGQEAVMNATLNKIYSSVQWNGQWFAANLAASIRDGAMIRRYLAAQGELSQRMFEDRMASAGRRSEAVGDLLSGRVRLRDAEGNQYEARAGSNYYYADDQQARTAPREAAVLGSDQWVAPVNGVVDLRPLEVIQ